MNKQNKLRRIASILKSSADELEALTRNIKLARDEVKILLKNANLRLPVETKHTKKESYIKVTYQDQRPELPEKVYGVPIRLVQKKLF